MILDECVLAVSLDDVWRTPSQIKRQFKVRGPIEHLVAMLRRLATEGRIAVSVEPLPDRMRYRPGRVAYQLQPITLVRYRRKAD